MRRLCQLIVAVMVAALPLVLTAAPARADSVSALLGLVNGLRATHGAAPLSLDPTLMATAQAWSAHMAATGSLTHNPSYGAGIASGWTKLGENVGEGGDLTAIFNAFVNSAFHFSNMVDPSYSLTGIAVVLGQGNTLWITQDFEARSGSAPPPTPASTAPTSPPVTRARPATTSPPRPPSPPRPVVTATAPTTPPTVPATVPATTPPAPNTTAAPAPPSLGGVLPGSDSPPTTSGPPGQGSKGTERLAAAATHFPANDSGGPNLWLGALVLALALVAFGGAALILRSDRQ